MELPTLEKLMKETGTDGYPSDLLDLASAIEQHERSRWIKAAQDVIDAADSDGWCQECALENIRPAVKELSVLMLGANALS